MMRKIDLHRLVAALVLGMVAGTAQAHGDEDHSQDAKKKAPAAVSVAGTMGAAGVAAAPRLAVVDRPAARRDWDEDRPRRDAA